MASPSVSSENTYVCAQNRYPLDQSEPKRSLKASVAWTLWSNIAAAGSQWGMVVAIAKLGNPAMVGQYALALAITAPILLFSSLQLRVVQATDVAGQFRFSDYLGLRLIASALSALSIAVIVVAGQYQRDTAVVILGVTGAKCIDTVSDVFYGYLQREDYMDCIARSVIARAPLSLGALALGVYLTKSVFVGTLGLVASSLLVLCLYDIPVCVRVRSRTERLSTPKSSFLPDFGFERMKTLVWTAFPLGIVTSLISLQTNIPRYVVEHYLGEASVGIFAALAYILMAGSIVFDSVAQSATARLARMFHDRQLSAFRALMFKLCVLSCSGGALASVGGWVTGKKLLALLYRPEYVAYEGVFLILLVSAVPNYVVSMLNYGMTAARLFWAQLPLSIAATATVALASAWLVPTHGLYGAAEAVLIATVLRLALAAVVMINATRDSGPIRLAGVLQKSVHALNMPYRMRDR